MGHRSAETEARVSHAQLVAAEHELKRREAEAEAVKAAPLKAMEGEQKLRRQYLLTLLETEGITDELPNEYAKRVLDFAHALAHEDYVRSHVEALATMRASGLQPDAGFLGICKHLGIETAPLALVAP